MAQRGGARPGAGRKKGGHNAATISANATKEAIREHIRQRVAAELDPMLDSQIAHAKGLKYLVAREKATGKFTKLTEEKAEQILAGDAAFDALEVWEKDPSVQAFTDLFNRTVDKPKEQEQELKITGELELVSPRLQEARKRLARHRS